MGIRTTSAGLKKLAKAYEIGTIYTNAYDKATYNDSEPGDHRGFPAASGCG